MIRTVLSQLPFDQEWMSIAGLLIFFSFFLFSVFWVYRKNTSPFYEELGRIPLDEKEMKRG
jgi:cbb3-type cytochrome oxidase subunit 3